jgi:hypothetical protein
LFINFSHYPGGGAIIMSDTVKKSILQPPEALERGCEIIIPITLKVRILIQPEVLGMQPICHLDVQQIEPESESCTLASPTDNNPEICKSNLDIEASLVATQEPTLTDSNQEICPSNSQNSVVNATVEINLLSKRQEPTWRHWLAKLKSFMINSQERKKRIIEHVNRSSNFSDSLLATSSNSEARKKQIMEHIQTNSN